MINNARRINFCAQYKQDISDSFLNNLSQSQYAGFDSTDLLASAKVLKENASKLGSEKDTLELTSNSRDLFLKWKNQYGEIYTEKRIDLEENKYPRNRISRVLKIDFLDFIQTSIETNINKSFSKYLENIPKKKIKEYSPDNNIIELKKLNTAV